MARGATLSRDSGTVVFVTRSLLPLSQQLPGVYATLVLASPCGRTTTSAIGHSPSRIFWEREPVPATADDGLAFLDRSFTAWHEGILARPEEFIDVKSDGPPGTLDGRYPFADVIQHVNAEVLSHGAEMCLPGISTGHDRIVAQGVAKREGAD